MSYTRKTERAFEQIERTPTLYQCGFSPDGKPFRETVEHWRNCKTRECRESHRNHEETRQYFARKYGSR